MTASEQTTNTSRAPDARALHVEIEDLDILLAAVTARLRRIAASGAAPSAPVCGNTDPIVAAVLDCADALDQVEASLRLEITRRRRLEQDVFDAYADLARMRAGLAPTTLPLPAVRGPSPA